MYYQRHIFKIEAANNVKSSLWHWSSDHLLTILGMIMINQIFMLDNDIINYV